ncbi:hypothetical protein AYO20_07262 [Fonsecaea nubica]|uniref:EthD domain-containing protein n=1 Tax=Fonsecaea nubica TaxID=856822 RepID=A0A178CVB9_9EURO|nr:hypothetical protein AYO20_07262 [Fonsecaea nubica]OAL33406.1 hypothetical protein AYO20_07262 [Fonsecaea nubica]
MAQPQPVTIMALVRRKASMTPEEYSRHWREVHAPIVSPWLAKHGVLKYRQVHISPDSNKIMNGNAHGGNAHGGTLKVIDKDLGFDGILEVQVPSWESFRKALEDPYYVEVVRPDEQNFFDEKQMVWSLGSEYIGVDGGKVLVGVEV